MPFEGIIAYNNEYTCLSYSLTSIGKAHGQRAESGTMWGKPFPLLMQHELRSKEQSTKWQVWFNVKQTINKNVLCCDKAESSKFSEGLRACGGG